MNITIDKALLWLVPYLYLVSVAYYWGYWGPFNIDALNYYPVSDLVKGVTSPLIDTLGTAVGLSVAIFIGRYVLGLMAKRLNLFWIAVIMVLIFLIIFFFIGYIIFTLHVVNTLLPANPKVYNDVQFLKHGIIQPLTMILVFIIASLVIESNLPFIDVYSAKYVARSSAIYFLLFFPCQAYMNGFDHAWQIQHNEVFDYVLADSLAIPEKGIYKYLGKAGEYHILLTLDNLKRVIIPVDKLTPLTIERFIKEDIGSIQRFKAHQKLLTTPAPQQKPPQQQK